MNVSYQHANPKRGNESFLLRVEEEHHSQTPCLLVDAGADVDTDALLAEDEYLAAILLTHGHVDHYQSLGEAHRDRAPILTSPDTAAVLDDVLSEGARHYDVDDSEVLLGCVEAVDGWRDVVGDTISVHPVPAGHTPGACGFFVRIHDGEETFDVVATGDFTFADAGGYPGFDPADYFDVDALFLTAATSEGVSEAYTDVVGTLTERAKQGSTTLCTASGLTGVHLAALLAGVDRSFECQTPVVLAGQAAKLYDALGYDHPHVETVPTFADPSQCLAPGTVTIAGPEVPVEGSSKALFDVIRDDGNATLVQVRGGSTTPRDGGDANCTVEDFAVSNHPTEAVLDRVVEELAPAHVVVTHQYGHALNEYKDKWDSYTWATGDAGRETLYADGDYVAPWWVGDRVKRLVANRDRQTNGAADAAVLEAVSELPTVGRPAEVDLSREVVDVETLRDRLRVGSTPTRPTEATATPESDDTGDAGAGAGTGGVARGGPYRTTGVSAAVPDDPPVAQADGAGTGVGHGGPVDTVRANPAAGEETAGAHGEDGTTAETVPDAGDAADAATEGSPRPSTNEEGVTSDDDSSGGHEEKVGSTGADTTDSETGTTDPDTDADDGAASDTDMLADDGTVPTPDTGWDGETVTVEVDPAVRALAERRADDGLETFTLTAVRDYLDDVLRGQTPWAESEGLVEDRTVGVDADPALLSLLAETADEVDADVGTFVTDVLAEAVGLDAEERTVEVPDTGAVGRHLDAIAENEASPYATRDEVVQAALERNLL